MRLHAPEILNILDSKPILISSGRTEDMQLVDKKDKVRQKLTNVFIPLIHKAEKFIFDSGSDHDKRTTDAVRETAVNMIEAKLFHMPFPLMWIEDPFTDDPDDETRNFYLVEETPREIRVQFFQRFNYAKSTGMSGRGMPSLLMHIHPLVIDLEHPDDKFLMPTAKEIDDANGKTCAEAIYSVKKLVVSLNTKDIIIERVKRDKERTGGDFKRRTYPHSIVRVPFETGGASESGASGGKRRRKHLVRGFVWGKNTRPIEQQRWIAPYWRGDNEVGVVQREHYEVG